ncbi:MAG: msrB [Candidatus Nomurabacteria bacterium]|nr:msrB [Candidatus Nomurabacteria bacterium]
MEKITRTEEEWRKELTPEQYAVLRAGETEMPFKGKYVHEDTKGTYVCVACGNPLFSSDAKFDSKSGWPSFDDALPGAVEFKEDTSHGMSRVEVVCAQCGSHLGHVFPDGPENTTGQRYCMNSVCLDLRPDSTQSTSSI